MNDKNQTFKTVLKDIFELPSLTQPKMGKKKQQKEKEISVLDQLSELEQVIDSKTDTDPLVMSIFLMVKTLFEQKQKETEIIESLQGEVISLKNKIVDLEYTNVKNQIRIQGLPLHKEVENNTEKSNETKQIFENLLKEMGCPEINFTNTQRIKIGSESKKPPPLIATFCSENDKNEFYATLPNLKNHKKIKIKVSNEYPKSLNSELKELQKISYDKRRRGFVTSIRYRNGNLILFTKKPGQSYSEYKELPKKK